jgi:hypothetical protein
MSRVAIGDFTGVSLQPSQKHTGHGEFETAAQQVTIHGRHNRSRVVLGQGLKPQHAHDLAEPECGSQAFPRDVTNRKHNFVAGFKNADEIARQIIYREDLPSQFKRATPQVSRTAESPLCLRYFKESPAHLFVFALQ